MTDVNSMLASVPTDFFSSAADVPIPASEVSDDAPIDDTLIDAAPEETAVEETPAIDEPADDEPAVDAAPADPATPSEPAEDLEEGIIKSKDAKGKYKYNLEESRYKTVYGNHQMVQKAADILGEPLTLDGIEQMQRVSLAHDRLWDHVTSGDPAQQALVVNEFIKEMQTAQSAGETGVDPTIPFAETIYSTLRDQAPDAYAHLRLQAARDLVGEMFETAAGSKNQQLFSAAQHFAATLAGIGPKPAGMTDTQYAQQIREVTGRSNIPFHTLTEMEGLVRGEDPQSALARENAELKAQLNGRTASTGTEQFSTWRSSNIQEVNKSVYDDAVLPSLSTVADKWKDFQDDYKRLVVDPLNGEVTKAVRADSVLNQRVADLTAQAQRATSEARRREIGNDIKQLFLNRARLAADKAKGPILKFAAEALQGRSAQTNGRRTAAQTRTAPAGTGTPVRQSVLPPAASFKNGMFDTATAMKQAMALVNTGR